MDNDFEYKPEQNTDFYSYSSFESQYAAPTPDPVVPEKREKEKSRFSVLTLVVCILVSAAVGISSAAATVFVLKGVLGDSSAPLTDESTNRVITEINVEETVDSVIEAVAEKVNPSVVGIATTASTTSFFGGSSESSGEGSGIIYSADGYIITNYHVIESAVTSTSSSIDVYLSTNIEKSYSATVVGYNISHDLAVIKISASGLTPIELADADKLKVGQYVAAIGSPGGLDFMGSVTYGIISGLDRVISDSATGSSVELIQTDAAINPGNSGGALVNTKGELVGVNSSKIAATEYEGMGFAIPVDTVTDICDKIISKENEPNPYIGITISERYTAEILERLGYPVGAVVRSVITDGPAYDAGIRSGDIITEFDGKKITEYTELSDYIADAVPGESVTVKIYRSGKYYSTTVKVASNNSQ